MGFFSRMKTKNDAMLLATVHSITDKEKTSVLGERLNIDKESLPHFHLERIFLECLAIDLAAHMQFGSNTRKKSKVLDGFYDKLYKHYYELSPKVAEDFSSSLSERLNIYSQIVRSYEDSDLQVAKAFAKFCEIDDSQQLIKFIQIYFIKQVKAFNDILSQHF